MCLGGFCCTSHMTAKLAVAFDGDGLFAGIWRARVSPLRKKQQEIGGPSVKVSDEPSIKMLLGD